MQFAKSGGGQKSAENMIDEALEQELMDFDFSKHSRVVKSG